jgi:hypothetical protein
MGASSTIAPMDPILSLNTLANKAEAKINLITNEAQLLSHRPPHTVAEATEQGN